MVCTTPMRWDEIIKRIENKENVKGAEIGVMAGEMSEYLLMQPNVNEYWCIDIWKYDQDYANTSRNITRFSAQYHKKNFTTFLKMAANYPRNLRIFTGTSDEAIKIIPDNYLDFVFIDGNHSYKYIKKDIMIWLPKIKLDGFISGHDYNNQKRFGVKKAVNEFFPNNHELGENMTWFVTRP